jgi:hypothetical protein
MWPKVANALYILLTDRRTLPIVSSIERIGKIEPAIWIDPGIIRAVEQFAIIAARDALAALQLAAGKIPVDTNYDVTKDGTVNSGDAQAILKILAGSK